jgi:hypothetical protein
VSSQNTKRGESGTRQVPWSPRVSAFLVCLLLAGGFWFIHALSQPYDELVKVKVEYVNLPVERMMPKDLPDSLNAKIQASGFSLLTFLWSSEYDPIQLDLSRARSIGGGEYALVTNWKTYSVQSGMGKEIKIVRLYPDTVVISFEGKMEKQVPVRAKAIINCAPMYRIGDSVTVSPQYVTLSGPEALLERISYVETEQHTYDDVTTNIDEDVKLVLPEGVTQVSVQPSVVKLHATIGKYTEGRFTIALNTINVPPNVDLKTFPDKVDVIFQVPVEDFAAIKPEMFRAVADYRKVQSGSQSLEVEVVRAPIVIRQLKTEPARVDFIIRK